MRQEGKAGCEDWIRNAEILMRVCSSFLKIEDKGCLKIFTVTDNRILGHILQHFHFTFNLKKDIYFIFSMTINEILKQMSFRIRSPFSESEEMFKEFIIVCH